jgi:hypothetical protein
MDPSRTRFRWYKYSPHCELGELSSELDIIYSGNSSEKCNVGEVEVIFHGTFFSRCGDPGVVQRIPKGLSQRAPQRGGVQEDIRELLPLWRRVEGKWRQNLGWEYIARVDAWSIKFLSHIAYPRDAGNYSRFLKKIYHDSSPAVRGARIQDVRRERRRHDRFSGIPLRSQRNVPRQVGAEVKVGLQHVRLGRQRVHLAARNAGNRNGMCQVSKSLTYESARSEGSWDICFNNAIFPRSRSRRCHIRFY